MNIVYWKHYERSSQCHYSCNDYYGSTYKLLTLEDMARMSHLSRLLDTSKRVLWLSVASLVVVITSTPTVVHSLQQEEIGSTTLNCITLCTSHSQLAAVNNQNVKEENDDLEPTPPVAAWPLSSVDIKFLYLAPLIFAIWVAYKSKEMLLTTQLRF